MMLLLGGFSLGFTSCGGEEDAEDQVEDVVDEAEDVVDEAH